MGSLRHFCLQRDANGYGFSIKDEGKSLGESVLVVRVEQNSSADRAGIRVGQRIHAINGRPVKSMDFLQAFNEIRISNDLLEIDVLEPPDLDAAMRQDSPVKNGRSSFNRHKLFSDVLRNSVETSDSKSSPSKSPVFVNPPPTICRPLDVPLAKQTGRLSHAGTNTARRNSCRSSEYTTDGDAFPVPSNQEPREILLSPCSTTVHPAIADSLSPSVSNASSSPQNASVVASYSSTPNGHEGSKEVSADVVSSIFNDSQEHDEDVIHHYFSGRNRASGRRAPLETDGTPPPSVKVVRKRAYASARHAGYFDQFAGVSPSHDTPSDSPSGVLCHIRPAASQPASPENACYTGPKITHLPRRRSTKTRSDGRPKPYQSSNAVKLAVFSDLDHSVDIHPMPCSLRPVNHGASPMYDEVPCGASDRRPVQPTHPQNKLSSGTGHLQDPAATAHDLLPTHFDANSNDLWTRAGEAYRSIDLADRKIAEKLAMKRNQLGLLDANCTDLELGLNKENDFGRSFRAPHAWPSPCPQDGQPPQSLWSQSCFVDDLSPLTVKSGAQHWLQLRNLCSGLRVNRSDASLPSDQTGGFLSRQCLCKILTLDGTVYKQYPWKIYHMSVSGSEVRFVKSSGFRSTSRAFKSNKYSKEALTSRSLMSGDTSLWPASISNTNLSDGSSAAPESDNEPSQRADDFCPLLSSSYLVLPIVGLIWHPTALPADVPSWWSLSVNVKPTSSHNTSKSHLPVPDLMNPAVTGISNCPAESAEDHLTGICENRLSDDKLALPNQSSFRCYRFSHQQVRTELLFIFPDDGVALMCLKMLEMSGGRQVVATEQYPPKLDSSHSLCEPTLTSTSIPSYMSQNGAAGLLSSDLMSSKDTTGQNASTNRPRLKDKRQRFLTTRLHSVDSSPAMDSRKGAPRVVLVSDEWKRNDSAKLSIERHSPVEERNSTTSSLRSGIKNPFLQGIRQLLHWPANSTSMNGSSGSQAQSSSSDLAGRVSAVLGDPPDFSELETPGQIFGAPLQNQVESPDYQYVPAFLHTFVVALEAHGLSHLGLYRKPGRQRSVSQFICIAYLVPRDLETILSLDAWNEPYVLCGLLKHFLRRLPVRLLDLSSWTPVASLVPEKPSPVDLSRLAYLLLSIRIKLWKMASRAFGNHNKQINLNETFNSAASFSGTLPRLKRIASDTHVSNHKVPIAASPTSPAVTPDSLEAAKWRWHTLNFVVQHLRRVVSFEHHNEVTYKCAAICFGPVLFDDTVHVDKLNFVLECLLQHWPWLTQGFPTSDDSQPVGSPSQSNQDYTLADAVVYVEDWMVKRDLHSSVNESLFEINASDISALTGISVSTSMSGSVKLPRSGGAEIRPLPSPADIRDAVRQVMLRAFARMNGDPTGAELLSKSQHSGVDDILTPSRPDQCLNYEETRTSHTSPNSPAHSPGRGRELGIRDLSLACDSPTSQPSSAPACHTPISDRVSSSAPNFIRRPAVPGSSQSGATRRLKDFSSKV